MLSRRLSAAFSRQQLQTANISSKIFIKGLPSYVTEVQLLKTLNAFGPIKNVVIMFPPAVPPENVKFVKALVHFHRLDSALAVEDELHGTMLELHEDGNHRYRIDVDFSFKELSFRKPYNNKLRAAAPKQQTNLNTKPQQGTTATSPGVSQTVADTTSAIAASMPPSSSS